jgi:uncharacterized protein
LKKALEALIELQDIDWKLQKLFESKGDLPQKVEILEKDLADKKELLKDKQAQMSEKSHKSRTLETDIMGFRENLKKYQSQLYQVKNNREYDAITIEIEETQGKIDQSEFEVLEIEEYNQELLTKITDLEETITDSETSLEVNQQELGAVMAKNRDKEKELAGMREKVLVHLPRPVLNHYERIRKGRGGMAISLLQLNACAGCSSRIPPQRAMEIRNMDQMFLCETCGRILVWRPDMDPKLENKEKIK